MLATFWNTTNLANYGTILGGIAVLTAFFALCWRVFMNHMKHELAPMKQLERNGGSHLADVIYDIRATQQHIHGQIDKMEKRMDDDASELQQHLGWHKGQS
jgi:hypothetical protein